MRVRCRCGLRRRVRRDISWGAHFCIPLLPCVRSSLTFPGCVMYVCVCMGGMVGQRCVGWCLTLWKLVWFLVACACGSAVLRVSLYVHVHLVSLCAFLDGAHALPRLTPQHTLTRPRQARRWCAELPASHHNTRHVHKLPFDGSPGRGVERWGCWGASLYSGRPHGCGLWPQQAR